MGVRPWHSLPAEVMQTPRVLLPYGWSPSSPVLPPAEQVRSQQTPATLPLPLPEAPMALRYSPGSAPISDRPRLSYKVLRSSCFASGSKGALQSCFSLYLPGNFFPYLIESLGQFEPKNELFYSGVVSSFSNINRFYYIIYVNCIN